MDVIESVSKNYYYFWSIQDNSDIKIECFVEDRLRNEKMCNVSAPFMRAKMQVRHHTLNQYNDFLFYKKGQQMCFSCGIVTLFKSRW